jgi:hypothetical protein
VIAVCERIDGLTLKPHIEENTMSTRSDFIAAQSRATKLLHSFGDSSGAAPFVQGESLLQYRARLAAQFQKYSKAFKDSNLSRITCPHAFAGIEDAIYNDAAAEATHPTAASLSAGELRAVVTMDGAGRPITKYYGDPNACWDQFNPPVIHQVRKFMTPGNR